MCFSFGSVPFSLFVFGIELHYSSCPWMEDFYRSEVLRRGVDVIDNDAQCGINGWALAGVNFFTFFFLGFLLFASNFLFFIFLLLFVSFFF